ncbi:MAG: hypothetical protein LH472_08495, partial [Pyrinomonadaceae bacterium]|nr:hypothetical protein [Pyrinomonadaceae bacterium]
HLHDNIHKEIESGKIIGVDDPSSIEIISGATKDKNGIIQEFDTRLERVLLAAKGNVSVHDLAGVVKLADAHPYLKELIASFADDYPELQARAIIKESSQLSGAALERMLTSAQNRLDRAAANYDQQLIKLRQMQIAAGSLLLREFKSRTTQQNLFAPFSLDSYERGQIDFQLKRSLLVEATEEEREDILTKKTNRAAASTFAGRAEQLRIAGYSDAQVDEILAQPPAVAQVIPNPAMPII